MTSIRNRDGPEKDGPPRLRFDGQTAATAPRQEERRLQHAREHVNPSGQAKATSSVAGPAGYPDEQAKPSTLIATFELAPVHPFKEAELHLVGSPDDGRRARLVYDLLWGRWATKPEDPDTGDTAGIPAPVPAKPPGLTDGAAVEVQAPALTP